MGKCVTEKKVLLLFEVNRLSWMIDKVEFEIVFSCYTLDLKERLLRLKDFGFSGDEPETITQSLRKLTNRIVHPQEGYGAVMQSDWRHYETDVKRYFLRL